MTKRLQPMIDDPTEPPYVRQLLEAGRQDAVGDYDFDKGLTKHLAQIEAGVPTPPWADALKVTSAGAVAASGSTSIAWLALPVVTASVIAVVMLSSSPQASEPRAGVAASPATPVPPATVPAVSRRHAADELQRQVIDNAAPAAGPAVMPEAPEPAEHPERSVRIAPQAHRPHARTVKHAPAGASTPMEHTQGGALPRAQSNTKSAPSGGGAPTAAPATNGGDAVAPEPTIAIEDPQPAESAASAEEPVQPVRAPQDDARLEREMAMLAMSQRVLHVDAERALKLARQGEAEFAGSMFTQERQQLLLLSLVKLGRLDEAKRLARPYLARYPKGPFSDRVRRALATGRVEH